MMGISFHICSTFLEGQRSSMYLSVYEYSHMLSLWIYGERCMSLFLQFFVQTTLSVPGFYLENVMCLLL